MALGEDINAGVTIVELILIVVVVGLVGKGLSDLKKTLTSPGFTGVSDQQLAANQQQVTQNIQAMKAAGQTDDQIIWGAIMDLRNQGYSDDQIIKLADGSSGFTGYNGADVQRVMQAHSVSAANQTVQDSSTGTQSDSIDTWQVLEMFSQGA